MSVAPPSEGDKLAVYDYCASFIDLLGQRALEEQGFCLAFGRNRSAISSLRRFVPV